LNAASRGLAHLRVTKGHPDEAKVSHIYKNEEVRRHVAYLQQHSCSCREWQLTGKPCPHALAVITSMRQPQMDLYVHQYYSVQKFQAAYHGTIPHIADRNQWPEVDKVLSYFHHTTLRKRAQVGQRRIDSLDHLRELGKELGKCNAKDVSNMDT
jgi:hypothetical protein